MTTRLKYTLTTVLLPLVMLPVVYLTLAWHVRDPLRVTAARERVKGNHHIIHLRLTNTTAYPMELGSAVLREDVAALKKPRAAGTGDFTVHYSRQPIRPGETFELDFALSWVMSAYAWPSDHPVELSYVWHPAGGSRVHRDLPGWLREHLPAFLADRVPREDPRSSIFPFRLADALPAHP